jgi:hypothetical protein
MRRITGFALIRPPRSGVAPRGNPLLSVATPAAFYLIISRI